MTERLRTLIVVLVAASTFGLSARQASSTSMLSGVVTTDEAPGLPVPRATVVLSGGGLLYERAAITDGAGRFSFGDLPAGRFTLTASKVAFVTTMYGAKRPGRPGTPFSLGAGERANVTLQLVRGATLTGTIRDHAGDPAPGMTVVAMRPDRPAGRGGSTTDRATTTDDRGIYRLFGLPPGDYVLATNGGTSDVARLTPAQIDTLLRQLENNTPGQRATALTGLSSYASVPIFFPGTPFSAEAEKITLAAGEERTADLSIQLMRASSVEGVVGGAGPSSPPIGVALVGEGPALSTGGRFGGYGRVQVADADGKFTFNNISPGRYTLTARSISAEAAATNRSATAGGGTTMNSSMGGPPPAPTDVPLLFASTDVSVSGSDVTGVSLLLQPGMTVSGRVVFDAVTAAPPADLSTIRVRLVIPEPPNETVTINGITVTRFAIPAVPAKADGTFEITGVMPGTFRMTSTGLGSNWWLRSAVINGRDVLDTPIDIPQGGDVTGALLTFTDRHNALTGTLQSASGAPASEFFVVVFPADRALWQRNARRMQSTRPGTDGKFTIRDLPAGEYFIAALTDVDPSDLNNTKFLDEIVPASLRVTIADGETKTQDLRIR